MKNIKKTIILCVGMVISINSFSQVGIGTTSPNADAAIDIQSSTKGVLFPRLALMATNNQSPLISHVSGMMVYNTSTAGTVPNNVTPGYYYNNGSMWIRIAGNTDTNTLVKGSLITTDEIQGTTGLTLASGVGPSDIPGCTFTLVPVVDSRIIINLSALGISTTNGVDVEGTVELQQNGTLISSQYFSGAGSATTLGRLGSFTSFTKAINLTAGVSYTFNVQAKSWNGALRFNNDPHTSGSGNTNYSGCTVNDANCQKTQISYQLFAR